MLTAISGADGLDAQAPDVAVPDYAEVSAPMKPERACFWKEDLLPARERGGGRTHRGVRREPEGQRRGSAGSEAARGRGGDARGAPHHHARGSGRLSRQDVPGEPGRLCSPYPEKHLHRPDDAGGSLRERPAIPLPLHSEDGGFFPGTSTSSSCPLMWSVLPSPRNPPETPCSTNPSRKSGFPPSALPVGRGDENLPIGIQLGGRRFGEAALLSAARWVRGGTGLGCGVSRCCQGFLK